MSLIDSEEADIREVFARFGLALYQAQCLERGLAIARASIYGPGPKRITRSQFEKLLEDNFRRTLGSLVAEFRKSIDVAPEFDTRLAEALDVRNWLAHRFFWDRAGHFKTPKGRDQMLAELRRAADTLSAVDNELMEVTLRWYENHGLSSEALEQYMKEVIDESLFGSNA